MKVGVTDEGFEKVSHGFGHGVEVGLAARRGFEGGAVFLMAFPVGKLAFP